MDNTDTSDDVLEKMINKCKNHSGITCINKHNHCITKGNFISDGKEAEVRLPNKNDGSADTLSVKKKVGKKFGR